MAAPSNLPPFTQNLFDREELRKNWGWILFLGLLFIGLGIVAIAASTVVTILSVFLLGVLLIAGGLAQVIYAFWVRKWSGFFLSLMAGILYAVVGFMLTIHPAEGALSLTLLFAAFYIVGGLFRAISAVMMRFELWGWAFFSGLIKFLLGTLVLLGWPETGLWVFGLFIGIDLVFYGWFWALLALGARNATTLR